MTVLIRSESHELEWRQAAMEMLARRLFRALKDSLDPRHPTGCHACTQLLQEAEETFRGMTDVLKK